MQKRVPSSGASSPCFPESQGDELKANSKSNKEENEEACLSDHDAMIFKRVKISCRIASELRDAILEGKLDEIHSVSFDLNACMGRMRQVGNCQELALREEEQLIVAIGFQMKRVNKCVAGARGEEMYQMPDAQGGLQEQVRPMSGPRDVMFLHGDVM